MSPLRPSFSKATKWHEAVGSSKVESDEAEECHAKQAGSHLHLGILYNTAA